MVIFQHGAEEMRGGSIHREEGGQRRRRRRENISPQGMLSGHRSVSTTGELYNNNGSLLEGHESQSSARTSVAGGFQRVDCSTHTEPFSLADHTGLEGYGRHLGSFENADNSRNSLNGMDTSDCSQSNALNPVYPTNLDSFSSAENSLLNYGRYLGSPPEASNHNRFGYSHLDTARSHGSSARSIDHDYGNGVLSDFQGLGSYSQPSHELNYSGFSNSLAMEVAETSNFCGYDGSLF